MDWKSTPKSCSIGVNEQDSFCGAPAHRSVGRFTYTGGAMRRGLWIVVVIAVIAAGLGLALRQGGDQTEAEIDAIVALTDPAARSTAALEYVLEHPGLEQEPLWRVLGVGLDSAAEAHGEERAVALGESLAALTLPPAHRQEVLSYLDFRYMQSEDPEAYVRGEAILRELLGMEEVTSQTLAVSAWLHAQHPETDKELALEAAMRTYALAVEEGTAEYVIYPVDLGYRAYVESVAERRGLDAGLAAADSLFETAPDETARGLALVQTYRLGVDDAPQKAGRAVDDMMSLAGFEATSLMNEVAYDMAERGFEPDLALELSERALELAPSRRDSVNILDTAGWAAYAAGRHDLAVRYLEEAVEKMSESLSLDVVMVDHLLDAYDAAGAEDRAIELLATVAARSPDADDPARGLLADRLEARDGTADALDDMVAALRYEGIEQAPDFSLPNRDGEVVSLEDLRGDVVVVAFWGYG
ncbi:MAG: redoxin domain-containing protein [Candidatus Eisenbacteria bacterium]|nr:redoxin domain-containing protein [Candidatus Eisenbacteria bacterium]